MRFLYSLYYILIFPFFSLMHRVTVKGRENIPEGGAVICANHSSLKDPIALAFAMSLKYHPRFMAKIELMRIPILGFLLKKGGIFGVNRGNSDITAIKTAMKLLKDGEKVVIFPEGTRVESADESAAKTGAIMLASKIGVPILPVYIPRAKRLFKKIEVVIGEPYSIEKLRGGSEAYSVYAKELMQKIEGLKT